MENKVQLLEDSLNRSQEYSKDKKEEYENKEIEFR